jgi:hypothetical protein
MLPGGKPMSDRSSILAVDLVAPNRETHLFIERCRASKKLRPQISASSFYRSHSALADEPLVAAVPAPACPVAVANEQQSLDALEEPFPPNLPRKPLGPSVEKAARYTIAMNVKLDMRRFVRFRVRRVDGSNVTLYRELDGVHLADYETVCLYEVKHLSAELMHARVGLWQLERSASILRHAYRVVRTRLVYIGYEADRLRTGLPSTAMDNIESDFGVIWITPDQIEAAAASLGVVLPDAWSNLDARYGVDPHGTQALTVPFAERALSA